MNKYLKTEKCGAYLDCVEFAQDLAVLLGGKFIAPEREHDNYSSATLWGEVEMLDGLRVHISTSWRDRTNRWVVRGSVDWRISSRLNGHYRPQSFPEARISSDKPLERIASEIRRRVIEPSAEPFAKVKADYADLQASQQGIQAQVAAVKAAFPWLKVDLEEGKTEATVYANGGGAYLSGRLTKDGAIYVDRCGTINADRAEAFLAVFAPRT